MRIEEYDMKKLLLLGLAIAMALPCIQAYGMEATTTDDDHNLAVAMQRSLEEQNGQSRGDDLYLEAAIQNSQQQHSNGLNNNYNNLVVNTTVEVGGKIVNPITLEGIPIDDEDALLAFQMAAQQEPKSKFYSRPFLWHNFLWNHKKTILSCVTLCGLAYWCYHRTIKNK